MELKLDSIPEIVGDDSKASLDRYVDLVMKTRMPLYFVGPSGSGKSLMAMNVAKRYVRKNKKAGITAHYVQLSPDLTKTALVLGLRLAGGSLVPVKGVVATAMENGDIIIIDEATHGTQEILLTLNSVMDRTTITSIGDEVVYAADTFRVIFCANSSEYAGNVKLPQSFARRLLPISFSYPSKKTEVDIVMKMMEAENANLFETIPSEICTYLVSLMRRFRSPELPLTVTNVAGALYLLSTLPVSDKSVDGINKVTNERNGEARLISVYESIFGSKETNVGKMYKNLRLRECLNFIYSVGRPEFVDAVLSAFMCDLDIEGSSYRSENMKEKLAAAIV